MFDYDSSIKNVRNILSSTTDVVKYKRIPKNKAEFTYDNGVITGVSALFVDMRKSTEYFKNHSCVTVSKVMRAYFSEIVSILRSDDNLRDIGIRGDCVYGIFTTPYKSDVADVLKDAIIINTFQEIFQNELKRNNFPCFEISIGLGCAGYLVVKVGQKGTGVCDCIWIG